MKTYKGWIDGYGRCHITVRVPGKASYGLNKQRKLFNHGDFNWGYGGSGPAQTALALLADALGDDERAVWLHQQFKWKVVCLLPQGEPWEMTDDYVREVAAGIDEKRADVHG